MKNEKVLIVLVDALRNDYLNSEDTPFLHSLSKQGLYVRKLVPGYGFCERSEILTGGDAEVTGNFTAYTYAPQQSSFHYLRHARILSACLDYCLETLQGILPPKAELFYDKLYRFGTSRLLRFYRKFSRCYAWNRIPFRFFHLFALTEDARKHTEPGAFSLPSIYDLLREKNASWHHSFQDLATSLQDPYDVALEKLYAAFREPHSFYSFAFGHIDSVCHQFGTSAEARRETLRKVDGMLKEMYEQYMNANPEGYVLFFGDHGMLDVNHVFNAEAQLLPFFKKMKWKTPRDIVYFLDSTMVRFWGDKAEEIREFVSSGEWSKYGVVVDEALAKQLGVFDSALNYGDVIWWANPGVSVFPDFFRRVTPPKGMHGYDVNIDDHKGLAILTGPTITPGTKAEGALLDIAPTVEALLHLDQPEQVVGHSWV